MSADLHRFLVPIIYDRLGETPTTKSALARCARTGSTEQPLGKCEVACSPDLILRLGRSIIVSLNILRPLVYSFCHCRVHSFGRSNSGLACSDGNDVHFSGCSSGNDGSRPTCLRRGRYVFIGNSAAINCRNNRPRRLGSTGEIVIPYSGGESTHQGTAWCRDVSVGEERRRAAVASLGPSGGVIPRGSVLTFPARRLVLRAERIQRALDDRGDRWGPGDDARDGHCSLEGQPGYDLRLHRATLAILLRSHYTRLIAQPRKARLTGGTH